MPEPIENQRPQPGDKPTDARSGTAAPLAPGAAAPFFASEGAVLAGQERFVAPDDEQGLGAVDAVADDSAPSSMWGEAWKQLRRRPIFWVSAVLIVGAVLLALLPGLFARTVYGARASVTVGVLTTLIVVVLGSVIGAVAGYFGGWVDSLLARFTDIFFAVPFVLAAIVVMQLFKGRSSILTVVLVLALFGWPQIARITRGAVMSVKNEDFVTASKSLGSGRLAILVRHVMPNAAAPIIVTATVSLGSFIVSEATLSFLGIGLPSTVVSWGADIATAQSALRDHISVLLYPAGALALTVLGFIMMGDAVRDALDPKARK